METEIRHRYLPVGGEWTDKGEAGWEYSVDGDTLAVVKRSATGHGYYWIRLCDWQEARYFYESPVAAREACAFEVGQPR